MTAPRTAEAHAAFVQGVLRALRGEPLDSLEVLIHTWRRIPEDHQARCVYAQYIARRLREPVEE